MNKKITQIGLFVILPLMLTAVFLVLLSESEATPYEDLVLKQGGQHKQLISGEEPVISPPIEIIGPER